MDLPWRVDADKLTNLYPGHFDPELSLFTFDSAHQIINNDFKDISNNQSKHVVKRPLPPNSLQLIRFRARLSVSSPSYTTDQVRVEAETLLSVLDTLQFPVSPVLHAGRDLRVEFGKHFARDGRDDETIFYVCGSRFCAIWVSYLQIRSTRVIMVNFMPPEFEAQLRVHDILRIFVMPEYQDCFSHPMFFALVIVRAVQTNTNQAYTTHAVSLQEIENGFVTIKSAGRIDTMQRLRDLGRLASRDKYLLITLQRTLNLARRADEVYCRPDSGKQDPLPSKQLHWHMAQLEDTIALNIAFMTSIAESVMNQQAALTGIIGLQDGASMKTIAVITMAFLPAAFVAALFAMPMLSWDDAQGHVISRQFWIYWAVTIPLTCTVLLIWLG